MDSADRPIASPPAASSAELLGRYVLSDAIASGGMATVHLGRMMGPAGFSRTVAIKRLLPHLARDPRFAPMFLDEARLAARVRHPNVVPTLDVVAQRGELFLVMEYVHGESLQYLARVLRKRGERVPQSIACSVLSGVLQGLHAAHEAKSERGEPLGIVHRDVSPHNVLVGIDGVARLLDFGVAKAAGRIHQTKDGSIKGKLAYMAPEQVRGRPVTRQTDLFGAAVVLWEVLVGRRLFDAENEGELIYKVLECQVDPPSRFVDDVPRDLERLVLRGLDPEPTRRFGSALEMATMLEDVAPRASQREVGEWVEEVAHARLERRSRWVEEIERVEIGDAAFERSVVSSGEVPPGAKQARVAMLTHDEPPPSSEVVSSVSEATTDSNPTNVRVVPPRAVAEKPSVPPGAVDVTLPSAAAAGQQPSARAPSVAVVAPVTSDAPRPMPAAPTAQASEPPPRVAPKPRRTAPAPMASALPPLIQPIAISPAEIERFAGYGGEPTSFVDAVAYFFRVRARRPALEAGLAEAEKRIAEAESARAACFIRIVDELAPQIGVDHPLWRWFEPLRRVAPAAVGTGGKPLDMSFDRDLDAEMAAHETERQKAQAEVEAAEAEVDRLDEICARAGARRRRLDIELRAAHDAARVAAGPGARFAPPEHARRIRELEAERQARDTETTQAKLEAELAADTLRRRQTALHRVDLALSDLVGQRASRSSAPPPMRPVSLVPVDPRAGEGLRAAKLEVGQQLAEFAPFDLDERHRAAADLADRTLRDRRRAAELHARALAAVDDEGYRRGRSVLVALAVLAVAAPIAIALLRLPP